MAEFPNLGKHCSLEGCKQIGKYILKKKGAFKSRKLSADLVGKIGDCFQLIQNIV
jgi:hypothetical protein